MASASGMSPVSQHNCHQNPHVYPLSWKHSHTTLRIGASSSSSTATLPSSSCFNANAPLCSMKPFPAPSNLPQWLESKPERPKVSCCALDPSSPHDPPMPSDSDDGAEQSEEIPTWDFQARRKRLQDIAARMKEPWRDILSSAGRRLQSYFDGYRKSRLRTKEDEADSEETETQISVLQDTKWDWERWRHYCAEVEEQESLASALRLQLDDAIASENFEEAASLKCALVAATANDAVSSILTELQKALEAENYKQAARLRDDGAAGLVGWWVGQAQGETDPYGRVINISSAHGRFVAKAYSARQLRTGSPAAALFEVFIRKDCQGYHQQAVYLQREGFRDFAARTPKSDSGTSAGDLNEGRVVEAKVKDLGEASEVEQLKTKDAEARLSHIIDLLKSRLPGVKVKVFNVTTENDEDIPRIVEEILEAAAKQENEDEKEQKKSHTEGELSEAKSVLGEGALLQQEEETPVRLIVGGMLEHPVEDQAFKIPVRIPASIEYQGRDSFIFHIEESVSQHVPVKEAPRSLRIATVSVQASADLVPPDVAKAVKKLEKVQVSKDIGEFLKLAISQAQRRRGLSKRTQFNRIKLMESSNNPFTGLYVGAFGPHTSELIQLRQKYGHWYGEETGSNSTGNLDFFEYVEAVKLAGDLTVPSGQVIFRAKTGKENRLVHRGVYPEEMGVVARYKGQGRLVEPGSSSPQWVDGELLLLDGKGVGYMNGAALGFVYSVPDRHLLVLFSRLRL